MPTKSFKTALKQPAALIAKFKAIRPRIVAARAQYKGIGNRARKNQEQRTRLAEEISKHESSDEATYQLAQTIAAKKQYLLMLEKKAQAQAEKPKGEDTEKIIEILGDFGELFDQSMRPYENAVKGRIASALAIIYSDPELEILKPVPDIWTDFVAEVSRYSWGETSSDWAAQAGHALSFIDKVIQEKPLFTWEK